MSTRKLHICFNLISDPGWHAGNIYIFNCIQALSLLPADERKRLFISISTRSAKDIPVHIAALADKIYEEHVISLAWRKGLSILPGFMRLPVFNTRNVDFYYPGGNLPARWIHPWGGWIPDFQYRHLPQLFSVEEWKQREARNAHLASSAPVLALSSEHALRDYITFFPANSRNAFLLRFVSSIDREWLNDDPVETQHKYNLPGSFFIVCNQFWKHKDHGTLIRAMAHLRKRGVVINAVCTGATEDFRNPDYYPGILKLAADLGVADQFIVLGFISRKDQIQLIRRSLAVIQPSLFEGWSTVVEDARSLGKNIFLSDFPVHIEQDPPYTWFFQQQNAEELAELIADHLAELQPGPVTEREEAALDNNLLMMREFGRNIVAMAQRGQI